MASIVVVAAHPDDEILGCGGTVAKHARKGDDVHTLIVAEGATSRSGQDSRVVADATSELARAAKSACGILGGKSVDLLGLPDNRLDSVDLLDVVKAVEAFICRWRPEIVYTHHRGDLNVDHRIVHDATVTACRPQLGYAAPTLLFFETVSSTEAAPPGDFAAFAPNWFEDISATLDVKIAALDAYAGEMRDWPHPRSIGAVRALAEWRGASVCLPSAEAFMLGRLVTPS